MLPLSSDASQLFAIFKRVFKKNDSIRVHVHVSLKASRSTKIMAHLGHHTLAAQTDAAERVGAISDDRTPDTDGVLSSLYYLCACTSCHFAELYSIDRRMG